MIYLRIAALSFVLVIFSARVIAADVPTCVPSIEIGNVSILRVEPNGMLVTDGGLAVKLESLLMPGGGQDRAPEYLARQSLSALSDFTHGYLVNLMASAPKEDRYGRLRAQVFVKDGNNQQWIQTAILSRGLARVSITPDRTECANQLYAAEAVARAKHAGIWTLGAYAILPASAVPLSDLGTFQIVEGRVTNSSVRSGRAYLNFGANWKRDFTVTIAPEDMKVFRDHDIDAGVFYAGKLLRVRGVIEKLNGPEIEIAAPEQIEIVQDARAQKTP